MSRIGKKPVVIPSGVSLTLQGNTLKAKGPKGELELPVHGDVHVEIGEGEVVVSVKDTSEKQQKALWGLFRSLVQNLVLGVSSGFTKQLELQGVGFKVAATANELQFALGFSHPVNVPIPSGISATVEKNIITISGSSKQQVGQFAANVRRLKEPEPYKGKGIRYVGENVRRKAGKAAKSVGK